MSFVQEKPSPGQQGPVRREVHVSQVTTETDLVARSNQLEQALTHDQHAEFCSMKVANSQSDVDETVWNFLRVRVFYGVQKIIRSFGFKQNESIIIKINSTKLSKIQ